MSSPLKRLLGVVACVVVAGVGIGLYIGLYLTAAPGTAVASRTPAGSHLYLATVPAAALNDPHPTWVSYYAVSPDLKTWHHDTTYVLPAHQLVTVTIYNFDSATGLRNGFLSQVEGTPSGTFMLDGKVTKSFNPSLASHVFSITNLNVSVPLMGIADNAKNPCSNAPCSMSNDHTTTTIQFRTPGPGLYRWQCFVPCAAGFVQGFGGPMQTVGYMDGFIKVV